MKRPTQGLTTIVERPATPTISPILTSSAPSSRRYPGKWIRRLLDNSTAKADKKASANQRERKD